MSEKRVAPPDGGSGDLVLIQRHLENLSAGEILEELDARMEEMTDPVSYTHLTLPTILLV